jgi:hypothetical protein
MRGGGASATRHVALFLVAVNDEAPPIVRRLAPTSYS